MQFHKATKKGRGLLGVIVLLGLLMLLTMTSGSSAALKHSTLSFRASSKIIKLGKPLFFKGRLLNRSRHATRNKVVVLQRKEAKLVIKILIKKKGGKKRKVKTKVKRKFWRNLGRKITNTQGLYVFGLKPKKSATYRVRVSPIVSPPIGVIVKPGPTPGPAPAPSANADRVGFAVGNNMVGLSDSELAGQLNGMATLGVKWIRHDLQWNIIQPSNSTSYNWSPYDRLVSAASQRNINILFILAYTPDWARRSDASGTMFSAPANNDQFAAFAKAAAGHYAQMGIHNYEVWNEPNLVGFWRPAPNIAAYTDLLKKTYTAVKQGDPIATVVSGGLSPAANSAGNIDPRDFVSGMYANGVKGYFDALGHHPYSYPSLPSTYGSWSAWSQISQTTPNIRGIMTNNGDSAKPIWGTEFGAPSAGSASWSPNNSESLQAKIIDSAWGDMQNKPWLQKLFIYSYKDIGTSTSTIENFFGVMRYNGTTKPAYNSVKNILSN